MFRRVLIFGAVFLFANVSHSQNATVAPSASPSLERRVADLEAYINNGARGSDSADAKTGSNISGSGPGHNGWMMTASALVLFMTLPGLALFYGGLVRQKNVLSVLAQCLGIAGLVAILWWAVGYSLVFSRGSPFIGGLKFAFLRGVDAQPNGDYSFWVSQNVFAMYQLMFAIITPALIIGAVAERIRFAAVLVFVGVWMVGAGMLWVGWYGFNAGSALGADGIAANAFTTTTLATAVASFTWAMLEYTLRGKPSVLAVGGTLGAFLTGVLATATVNPNLASSSSAPLNSATQNGLARIVGHTLWLEQLKAIAMTILVAVVGSAIIGAIVRGLIGLRIAPEIERQGLDIDQHGEEGYITSG